MNISLRTRRQIKIAVSLLLVAGLLWFLDLEDLRASIEDIRYSLIAVAILMVLMNRILMPLKWNLLLRARGIEVSNYEAVRVYTISSFLGLVLPPTVGADSIRSYYFKQAGLKLSEVVASIAIERAFGLLVLLLFTLAGFGLLVVLLRDSGLPLITFSAVLAAVALTATAALSISFSRRFRTVIENLASRLKDQRLGRLAGGAEKLVRAYQDYRHSKRTLFVFTCLTAVELLLVILRSYVVARALGVDLSLAIFFAFLPLVTLLNRMPISFDGFGINEGLFIYFLGLFGVMAEKAFLIGLVNHLIFIIGVLPGGIFFVLSRSQRAAPGHP